MSPFTRETFPYCSTARAAHNLADLLKRTRPTIQTEVVELQRIVKNAHGRLDDANCSAEVASAWGDLSAAYQILRDLRRPGKS